MKLKNVYECTFVSDKGNLVRYVAADSFGRAANMALNSIQSFKDREAYELVKIVLSNLIFVD